MRASTVKRVSDYDQCGERATNDAGELIGVLALINLLRPRSPRLQRIAEISKDSFQLS